MSNTSSKNNDSRLPSVMIAVGIVAVVAAITSTTFSLVNDLDQNSKAMKQIKMTSPRAAQDLREDPMHDVAGDCRPSEDMAERGKLLSREGRLKEALVAYRAALPLAEQELAEKPQDAVRRRHRNITILDLARCENQNGNSKRALQLISQASEISNDKAYFAVRREVYFKLGRLKDAEADQQMVQKLSGGLPPAEGTAMITNYLDAITRE